MSVLTPATLGGLAVALTTFAFLPQVIRVLRTRSTADLSLVMLAMQSSGNVCWFAYGHALGDLPLMIANGVTGVLVTLLLVLKLFAGWERPAQAAG